MGTRLALQYIFGVPPREKDHSYVDRGGLDQRLRYALSTDRHVIIHGDSKQGKTWLRQQVLTPDDSVTVQCQIGATPASLFMQLLGLLGVKAELRETTTRDLQGKIDLSASGELGVKVISRFKLGAKAGGSAGRSSQHQLAPIGQTPGDLAWVARVLEASGKRVVIEDFHYLGEESRREFAFLLKALGDYGVHPVIIGVWSQDHLLTYYNGDLAQRVEDIHLVWTPDDLEQVLIRGNDALNISMSASLRRELVRDAYGNVGTLQAFAEAVCKQEGIYERRRERAYLTPGPPLDRARKEIAVGMRPRFESFAGAYAAGLRDVHEVDRPLLLALIATACDRPDDELISGIPADVVIAAAGASERPRIESIEVLGQVEQFQALLQISPMVLTFNKHAQTISLIDRRFLFYRRHGEPRWPWSDGGGTGGE